MCNSKLSRILDSAGKQNDITVIIASTVRNSFSGHFSVFFKIFNTFDILNRNLQSYAQFVENFVEKVSFARTLHELTPVNNSLKKFSKWRSDTPRTALILL